MAPRCPCAQATQASAEADETVDVTRVRVTAERELREETFRSAVEREKARIRVSRTWWHALCPFKFTITRR